MRQAIITLCLVGSFMVYALTIDLFDSIFMFVLFGVIPGRAQPLPANQMLLVYTIATSAVLSYALRAQIYAVVGKIRFTLPKRSSAS